MALKCPQCEYDLRGSMRLEGATCPECDWKVTRRDLQTLQQQPDRAGRLEHASPHEVRASGWVVLLGIIIPVVFSVIAVVIIIWKMLF